ncbi:MAG TPA: hypothetical protein PK725_08520 [Rhodocyclaceae bacterium]|nr:hypothetical protein [Rhodocyclaceae bacterium]
MNHTMTAVNDVATQDEAESPLQSVRTMIWEADNPEALELIERSISERVTSDVSAKLAQSISLARYFRVVEIARKEVEGLFTEGEVCLLLTAPDSTQLMDEFSDRTEPIYRWMFAYDDFWDGKFSTNQEAVLKKLAGLTRLQELGVVDIIECAWRSPAALDYAMSRLCKTTT